MKPKPCLDFEKQTQHHSIIKTVALSLILAHLSVKEIGCAEVSHTVGLWAPSLLKPLVLVFEAAPLNGSGYALVFLNLLA